MGFKMVQNCITLYKGPLGRANQKGYCLRQLWLLPSALGVLPEELLVWPHPNWNNLLHTNVRSQTTSLELILGFKMVQNCITLYKGALGRANHKGYCLRQLWLLPSALGYCFVHSWSDSGWSSPNWNNLLRTNVRSQQPPWSSCLAPGMSQNCTSLY